MTTATLPEAIHPFEAHGLGKAPFRIVGHYRDVGPRDLGNGFFSGAPGQPMGTCDYCSTGIALCVVVMSSDDQKFIVGCDCADKVGCDTKDVRRKFRNEAQEAKREAARLARAAKREANLQDERNRNGGLTDRELEALNAKQVAAVAAVDNEWLITALNRVPHSSSFVDDMQRKLEQQPLSNFSDRQLAVLCQIYAKLAGRSGSKAYLAAEDHFNAKADR